MKKILIGSGIVVIVALFIGINLYRSAAQTGGSAGAEFKTGKLEEKEIAATVMVPGKLKFENEQSVFYEADKGDLDQIKVKEGDKVKKGTVLLTYTNEQLKLEKEKNELAIESSQLKLKQINEKKKALNKKEKEAGEQFESQRSELDMEEKTAKLELRQYNLEKKSLERQLSDLEVRSEIEGTVISVEREAASKKSKIQEPVIHIGNTDRLIVEGALSEYDTLKVKKGQKVALTSDVIQDHEWRGRVAAVGLVPERQNETAAAGASETEKAVQYPLKVKIAGRLPQGKPGFKLIMNIETDKRKANTLPAKAVKKEDDQYYVYTVKDGKATRVDVKIGETVDNLIEIKDGISPDDQVILNPSDDLTDGTDVRV
ncbi:MULTISPECIES: efflux RND transporter periplasmic adaptor subunit [Bacillus]|uniref:efflux RND transporter periplasmic adaptor subunit n=1 Tax=Bacillus TaxID=1386 RepID=UPI001582581A|nr:efflux RND transporter periplasmic adaptor subunit [Bacillus glycinifermentans]MBU8788253.1 efflux RND transporter periplasmic adaptor subunit [Bacillus glycinifermentans]NUJ18427.1 efflux RND transporter periplasmic adaptor subunit [Bacillus glycinifermentans]